ncbi:hypothetical protein JFL43_10000 [Viridibacillus sp. YIM B01967]|uniref:Intracellular proteinase inhibitor BsuPI domain-containing protein n=1 Tax=Viridibacillus soli TaxID=2798301 RepID=A0ABS1H7A1_9BACL|nr:hypothetical protein [Viridibacillus soli]MBK3495179.1 hypothetical protein [Viridibacillus soli]
MNQSTIFQNEGLAGFMYRGGQSLEVKITNKGTTYFKWVLITPDGSRFHTGTLQEGKVMKWNYPDVDTPNGFYSLYVYNAGGEGIVELFPRNIEFK